MGVDAVGVDVVEVPEGQPLLRRVADRRAASSRRTWPRCRRTCGPASSVVGSWPCCGATGPARRSGRRPRPGRRARSRPGRTRAAASRCSTTGRPRRTRSRFSCPAQLPRPARMFRDRTDPPRGSTLRPSRGRGGGQLGGFTDVGEPAGDARLLDMITVEALTKKYGRFTAVDDVSFTAAAGRVTGFLGPNGAGKSTTMRIMVGLTPPTVRDHDHQRSPLRRAAQPRPRGRRPAGRLGPARGSDRPRDPVHRPAHDGPARPAGRRDAGPGQPDAGRGRSPGAQLLARHAPAARHRHRPDRGARRSSSSTSRPTASTRPASAGCATCCATTPTRAGPSCSPRTCCTRSR